MKPLKIYLDTSIISFLYAEDTPDLRKITQDFFSDYVRTGRHNCFVSEIVVNEIQRTRDIVKRNQMLEIVRSYQFPILDVNDEVNRISSIYMKEKIIPRSKPDDARHIAIATCEQMDVLLSWNFKHLANINKQRAIKVVNELEGYLYPLVLTNPMEVMYEKEKDR
jgi:predicted nucleic acid-binding protein